MPVGQQLPAVPIREPARMTANPAPVRIEVLGTDGAARHGRLVTPHGTVETPVFMPVGTQATVKGPAACPPHETPGAALLEAVRRTLPWAERCRASHRRPDQALFGIVQGGTDVELRGRCAEALIAIGFDGYALGGFSVGETATQ